MATYARRRSNRASEPVSTSIEHERSRALREVHHRERVRADAFEEQGVDAALADRQPGHATNNNPTTTRRPARPDGSGAIAGGRSSHALVVSGRCGARDLPTHQRPVASAESADRTSASTRWPFRERFRCSSPSRSIRPLRRRGHEDLADRGLRSQVGRDVDRIAQRREVTRVVRPNHPDERGAGVHARAQRDPRLSPRRGPSRGAAPRPPRPRARRAPGPAKNGMNSPTISSPTNFSMIASPSTRTSLDPGRSGSSAG